MRDQAATTELRTLSSAAALDTAEGNALPDINFLRPEVIRFGKEVTTLETGPSAQSVNRAAISVLNQRLAMFDQNLRELRNSNEWTQSSLKNENKLLKSQLVIHEGDNLTRTEAIHRKFVQLGDQRLQEETLRRKHIFRTGQMKKPK